MTPAPTVADINQTIIAQLEASLNQTIPLLPKAFNRVLAKTLAAVFVLLWKYAGFIALQMFVKSATMTEVTILGRTFRPLVEWGRLIGVGGPVAAVAATLEIDITVTNQVGSLDSGTQFLGVNNGVTYLLVGSVPLSAPVVVGQVTAAGDQSGGNGAGAIGNLVAGDIVSFANPLANVARDATVTSQVVTGANEEAEDIYRQRIVDRFQKRPQGGALIDYEAWGEEVAGIINIYPYTGVQSGTIDVFAEATVLSSGNPDGIPTAAQLTAVAASIQWDMAGLASRRPAGSFIFVNAITRTGFDVSVINLAAPNLAATQAQLSTGVIQYFLDREPFVSGVTLPPRRDEITKSALIGLVESIVTAAGGTFDSVDFAETGVGGNLFRYTLGAGEKAKLTEPLGF